MPRLPTSIRTLAARFRSSRPSGRSVPTAGRSTTTSIALPSGPTACPSRPTIICSRSSSCARSSSSILGTTTSTPRSSSTSSSTTTTRSRSSAPPPSRKTKRCSTTASGQRRGSSTRWMPIGSRTTTGASPRAPAVHDFAHREGAVRRVQRNPNWWGDQNKYFAHRFNVDKIRFTVIRDTNVAWEYFLRGELDSFP